MTQDPQSGQPSTSQTAKEQAAGVAHGAVESGHRLVDHAKEQAGGVGRVAGRQAQDVLHQGRTELTEQAAAQQRKVAGGLRSFSEELGSMAESSDQSGLASDLARQVATRVDSAAGWLDEREPGALLEEVKTFARNRPGTFLAVAAAAGLLAGRLTRGLKDASGSDEGTGSAPGGASDATAPAHRAPGAPSTGTTTATTGAATGAVWSEAGAGGTTAGGATEDIAGVPQRTSAYAAPSTYAAQGGGPTTQGSADDTMAYGTTGAGGTYPDPTGQTASAGYGTGAPDASASGTYGTGTYGTGTYDAATGAPGAAGGVDPLDRSQEFDPEQRPTWTPVEDEGEQR